ncbi:LPS export ABC transporter periplasmic protein LptC [Alteromonas sp. CYL-A6]|uniref:LPS export ABC transporter periplasmic protein LptC n=1 Tax=Alteromonas nitratireducens TaxID=3390813 RepID=UPI0034B933BF
MMHSANSRLTFSISALFVLAVLLYIPTWMEEQPAPQKSSKIDALNPAYRATNLMTTIYDEDGNLNHQVFAARMEHYDQLGFVLFSRPRYTVYTGEGQSPWLVTAKEGTLYNNDVIQLDSDVTISSQANDNFVQTIRTEFIEINLDSKKMTSDQPVEIMGSRYVISSNGFKADLQSQQYELIDHVQTVYSPGN